jgi:hypothetical protein
MVQKVSRITAIYDVHGNLPALQTVLAELESVNPDLIVVGAIALLGTFFLSVTGGSPYLQFALALIFFAMFIVGSYWWMVFGPGSKL